MQAEANNAPCPTMGCLLAASDLSSRSDRALRRAAMLARASDARFVLLHAVDDDQPRRMIDAERREAWALLGEQVASMSAVQATGPTILVEEGDPFEAVLRVAEAQSADLIVLGEHRRRPLRDLFAGTTVERVMRHGVSPVLMVNQPPASPYHRILAATDLSAHSAHAVRSARDLGLLALAELTLLHAFEAPARGAITRAALNEAGLAAHVADAAREADTALTGFVASLGLDRAPTRLVEEGGPAAVIGRAIERLRPDLLIIATAGAGLLRRAMIGSVAAAVLAEARCDVLAVPPAQAS